MAANPALVRQGDQQLPAPFPGEVFLCCREELKLEIDSVRTRSNRWSARGNLFLSNLRMVFVAYKSDPESNLVAFEFPLRFLRKESFQQPIFGCNHIAAECWQMGRDGTADATNPPHKFKLYFIAGGVGTFLPLFSRYVAATRGAERDRSQWQQLHDQHVHADAVNKAFVDPNDPTSIYLVQPVGEEDRLPEAPKYAKEYGRDEEYQPMV